MRCGVRALYGRRTRMVCKYMSRFARSALIHHRYVLDLVRVAAVVHLLIPFFVIVLVIVLLLSLIKFVPSSRSRCRQDTSSGGCAADVCHWCRCYASTTTSSTTRSADSPSSPPTLSQWYHLLSILIENPPPSARLVVGVSSILKVLALSILCVHRHLIRLSLLLFERNEIFQEACLLGTLSRSILANGNSNVPLLSYCCQGILCSDLGFQYLLRRQDSRRIGSE